VDFGELNDKAIKGLMDLSNFVSRFYLYIHEQPLRYLFLDEYYMAHIGKGKYMDDPVVWTSLGPLPRWVPGPTTRWAPGTTRLALHGT
jgi:hypothetical protein